MQKRTSLNSSSGHRLQWDDVRYFLELARLGSLSAAARTLGVEHSTVARRIESLEQSLGIRVFDRLARGWSLTREGEILTAQAQRLDDEAQAFSRAALGAASLRGTVRLSAPPVFGSHFLVPKLAAVRSQWQNIDLQVIGESRDANLFRSEADLAIRLLRPTAPGLTARRLGELGYGAYAAHGYTSRPAGEWEFLGYDDRLRHVPQQRWIEQVAGDRPFVLRSNDLAALAQAARAGLGIAALPHFLAAGDATLALLSTAECPAPRPLWLVMHPDVKRSPRVRRVADVLIALVGDMKNLLLDGTC
ncbi:MAG TPA: LysR family transcriptional regulator [Frateuria sp.]|uniref:LysR family transcriptional regulator n=1 Tax=Frateuria sp. TaxID=2211372 RepID=UPI002DF5FE21|nr:LysR family transcriptional regulator [Frateuria sp.]